MDLDYVNKLTNLEKERAFACLSLRRWSIDRGKLGVRVE